MTGYWNHIPLFRYLVPFVFGIIISIQLQLQSIGYVYCFFGLVFIYFLFQIIHKLSASFRLQPVHGFLFHLLLFFGGICIVIKDTPVYHDDYFMVHADSISVFECRINKPPEPTGKNIKLYIDVDFLIKDSASTRVNGKSIVYIKTDTLFPQTFNYGDIIYIKNKFTEPQSPKNPEAFDYKKYLKNLKIYHVAFLKEGEYKKTNRNEAKTIWTNIYGWKSYFIRLMEKHIKNENSLSVGVALIIGQKSVIPDEVQQAYANTGTMHILAVSGLHVGILYVILEFLFRPFSFFFTKRSKAALFKTVIILIIIWLYACLSGLSPSVNRSAVMFTFLALGKLYDQQIDSFNILFVSMFPLLLDDPYQITQVGFQLSYLAVGGIVFFQPLIYNIWKPINTIVKYFWSMTSVSIAAQIVTSPIGIYYFHQFPNYFLLSNIVAIPVSFLILVLGVAFFVLGAIPFVGSAIAFLLDWCLRIMNNSVIRIEKLPYSVTDNLNLNTTATLLLYLIIIFFGAFLVLKEKKYFLGMLAGILLCSLSLTLHKFENNNNRNISIYNLKKNTAIVINNGTTAYVFTDTDSLRNSEEYSFHLKNDFIKNGIKDAQYINIKTQKEFTPITSFYYRYPFLFYNGTTLYFLDKETRNDSVPNAEIINYVILTQDPFLKIDSTSNPFPNATYIIDNTNSWKSSNYFEKQFGRMGIPVYSVKGEGCYRLE